MLKFIKNILGMNKEKIEPPEAYAIIKLNDVAKLGAIYDDENKIIELHRYGRVDKLKYSEADVELLREQAIPVLEEEYSEDFEFLDVDSGGSAEIRK